MYQLLKLIFRTGIITEDLGKAPHYACSQSEFSLDFSDNLCLDCSICTKICPVNALHKYSSRLFIDYQKCIFCARCLDNCPHNLIDYTNSPPPLLDDNCQIIDYSAKDNSPASLHVRHLDAGSCNACDFEMSATLNPYYDLQRFGVDFVASPKHADILLVTGMITRNLLQAVEQTYNCMPRPGLVMAVGACACGGNLFGEKNYAQIGPVSKILPVDIYLPGCPPTPKMFSYALIHAAKLLRKK